MRLGVGGGTSRLADPAKLKTFSSFPEPLLFYSYARVSSPSYRRYSLCCSPFGGSLPPNPRTQPEASLCGIIMWQKKRKPLNIFAQHVLCPIYFSFSSSSSSWQQENKDLAKQDLRLRISAVALLISLYQRSKHPVPLFLAR